MVHNEITESATAPLFLWRVKEKATKSEKPFDDVQRMIYGHTPRESFECFFVRIIKSKQKKRVIPLFDYVFHSSVCVCVCGVCVCVGVCTCDCMCAYAVAVLPLWMCSLWLLDVAYIIAYAP
jgi:hypothetical protein